MSGNEKSAPVSRSALVESEAEATTQLFGLAVGCWVWDHSLPGWFHGVPLVNFVAWMCALVPFGYVMFRVQERRGLRDGAAWGPEDLMTLLKWTPAGLTCAALAFMGMTLVIEGVSGPSWTLLNIFTARVFAVL